MCDYRCGSRVYGDLHCNWRGLGQTCRFCFHDAFEASLADETAKVNGSRVILCATHEPPTTKWSDLTQTTPGIDRDEPSQASPAVTDSKGPEVDDASITYSGNITRGEMCAFLSGYFEFLPEARVAVSSVVHFMPGMRVGIATNPRDFQVFNRSEYERAGVYAVLYQWMGQSTADSFLFALHARSDQYQFAMKTCLACCKTDTNSVDTKHTLYRAVWILYG